MKEQIQSVVDQIKTKIGDKKPKIAMVLGSGLGGVADAIEEPVFIPYEDVKNFPRSTVKGHAGRLVIGKLKGKEVLCMQGRVHLYEGVDPIKIVFLMRILKILGIEKLLLTNAAGSLRRDMEPGSLMVISDHINLSGFNPLIGPNDDEFGPRFPDMSQAYNKDLSKKILSCAKQQGISMHKGVYLMASGPNFETPAEIRAFQTLGGDAVGMSTVPETLAAVHCGITVAGVSVITNFGSGMVNEEQSHTETIEQGTKAGIKLQKVISKFIEEL